jgi:hypothetical protein
MKTKLIALAALLAILASPLTARAGVRIGLGFNFPICFGCPRPAYVAPAPVYVVPAPAPVYVVPAAQPVYVQPAPAPYSPPARPAVPATAAMPVYP